MGHQSYVLLCAETTLSDHPVVIPKPSCDVHLLRSPWRLRVPNITGVPNKSAGGNFFLKINKTVGNLLNKMFRIRTRVGGKKFEKE